MTIDRILNGSLAVLILALVMGVGLGADVARAEEVPYDDPGAIGSMTLCDKNLQPVTSGSLTDRPFVWRAVSDTQAPAPYDDKDRRAVLYYFQPRENVDPGEWSSEILTAASTYSDPQHPIAQATPIDFPLVSAATNLPPVWDGFAQLRMYFTTQNAPQSSEYVAADIRIQGDRWSLVRGGDAPCDAGKAVSPELALPDYDKRLRQVENGTDDLSKEFGLTPADQGIGDGRSEPGGQAGNDDDGAEQDPAVAAASPTSGGSEGDGAVLWGALIVAALVIGGVGAAVAWMNRRSG